MHNFVEEDGKDENVQYIVKKRRKPTKKFIYEDYVDGDVDSNENDQNEENDNNVEEVVEKNPTNIKKNSEKRYK